MEGEDGRKEQPVKEKQDFQGEVLEVYGEDEDDVRPSQVPIKGLKDKARRSLETRKENPTA